MKKEWILIVVLTASLLLGACSASSPELAGQAARDQPVQDRIEKDQDVGPAQAPETGPAEDIHADTIPSRTDGEISGDELAGLLFMREEEKLARDVYLQLADQWGMNIFSNIAGNEETHMDSVLTLIELFGASDPVGENARGVFANQELGDLYSGLVARGSQSLAEALLVGGAIEEIDILDLQEYLSGTEDGAIREVYVNLLQGSINHLAAFARTYERQTGESYQPQYLSQEAFQELLSGAASAGNSGFGLGMNGAPQGRGQGRQ